MFDAVIVGCGVVGAACAYSLSKYQLNVAILEKENDVAMGTSRANSAIIHAGFDPKEGTLMAKLNVEGTAMAKELCEKLSVPYKQIGSLVISFSEEDDKTLEMLYERGIKNGVPDLKILSRDALLQMEPNVSENARKALYAPTAGVISPWEYTLALAETAVKNGVELHLETEVIQIEELQDCYILHTNKGDFKTKYIINCAGVKCGALHEMVASPSYEIIPTRGQYYLLDKSEGTVCSHVLFRCPSFKGKGVLVSPTVHGNLIVGPDAEPLKDETDTGVTLEGLSYLRNSGCSLVPSVNYRNSIRNFAGIRANSNLPDFFIDFIKKGFLDVAGIKSPGLSAAPAIGEYVRSLLEKDGVLLKKKEHYDDSRRVIRMKELSSEEKNQLISKEPAYGRVICRCETITEGEMVAAMHSVIPATTVDGVKRRTNAGMGRCQGGFCGPRVLDLLARELHLSKTDILKDKTGSNILIEKL